MDTRVGKHSVEGAISDGYLNRLSTLIHSSGVAETEAGYTEYYFSAENLRKKTFSTQSFEKLDQGFSLEQTIQKFPDTVVSGVFLFPFLLKVFHASSTDIRNLWRNLPEYVGNRSSITFRRIDLICREEAKRRCIHLGNTPLVEAVIEQVPGAVSATISEKVSHKSVTSQYELLFHEMFDSTTRELSVPDGDVFHRLEEFLQIQNQDKVETPAVKRLPLRDISADNQELSDAMILLVGLIQVAISEDVEKLTELSDRWTKKMHKYHRSTSFPLSFFLRVSAVLKLIEIQIQDQEEEDTNKTDATETATDEIATDIPVKEFLLHANLLIHELHDLELRAKDGGCIEVGEHIRTRLIEVFQLDVPTKPEGNPMASAESRVEKSHNPIEKALLAHESDDKFWNELKTVLQIGHGFWKYWVIFADTYHFPAPKRGTTEAPGGFYKRTLSLADNRRETFIQFLFTSMEKLGYTERIRELTTVDAAAEETEEESEADALPPSILPTLNTKRQSEVRFFAKLRPLLDSTRKDSSNYDGHGFWERWLELAREFGITVPPTSYRQPIGVFYKKTFNLPNTKVSTFVEYVASQLNIKA